MNPDGVSFLGFVAIGTANALPLPVVTRDSSGNPASPDSPPSYKVFAPGATSPLQTGNINNTDVDSETGLCLDAATITGAEGFASGTLYIIVITYSTGSGAFSDKVLRSFVAQ